MKKDPVSAILCGVKSLCVGKKKKGTKKRVWEKKKSSHATFLSSQRQAAFSFKLLVLFNQQYTWVHAGFTHGLTVYWRKYNSLTEVVVLNILPSSLNKLPALKICHWAHWLENHHGCLHFWCICAFLPSPKVSMKNDACWREWVILFLKKTNSFFF